MVVLLLKDIYRGWVRIGHSKTAGMGRLGLKSCKISAYVNPACTDWPVGPDEKIADGDDAKKQIGSFEKRSRIFEAPTDLLANPSWVKTDDPWYTKFNDCAQWMALEAEEWAEEAAAHPVEGGQADES